MKALTYKQYQQFLQGKMKVKVVDKEDLFFGYVCPVFSIANNWVTCDVDNDGGTTSFDYNQVELTNENIKYNEY